MSRTGDPDPARIAALDMSPAQAEFWARHRGATGCAVYAQVVDEDGHMDVGVFSSLERAYDWVQSKNGVVVFLPMIIDHPEWTDAEPC